MKMPVSRPTQYHYDLYFCKEDDMYLHLIYPGVKRPAEFTTTVEDISPKSYTDKHGMNKVSRELQHMENRLMKSADPTSIKKETRVSTLLQTPLFQQLNSTLTRNQRKRKNRLLKKITKDRNW